MVGIRRNADSFFAYMIVGCHNGRFVNRPYDVVLKGWFYCRAMLAGSKRLSPTGADSGDRVSTVCPMGTPSR